MSEAYSFLRKIPLFANLPDEDLEQLCQMVEEMYLHAGETLLVEGSIGDRAYVIKEGQVEISKNSGGRAVQIAIREAGEVIGEIALLESSPRTATVKALTDCLFYVISQEQFDHLLDTSPSAARIMLHSTVARLRQTELHTSQSDKMAQLGTLTAGIAHELNNPAAAARRGAQHLLETLDHFQGVQSQLFALHMADEQFAALSDLVSRARASAGSPPQFSLMERGDLEGELEDWLDEHGVENGWEFAPTLVELGYAPDQLERLLEGFPAAAIPVILRWLAVNTTMHNLLTEIDQGTARISEIVKALKSYAYLDQAPVQEVDVPQGLENTLVILRHKLKNGVEVERDYDPGVPRIQAYASELNQVWTNIIDNAVDAMGGKGKITLRTQYKDPWVVVDISDNGPGIPEDVQKKIFNPFFTTKPLGQGTGMGLNISYNIIHKHGGDIKVTSTPGETHFEVWLPVNFDALRKNKNLAPIHRKDNDGLRSLLESAHTIAVVGLSDKPEKAANRVPAYLQRHGYRIIPVNPNLSEALCEKSYPDLRSIPEAVDVVLIFRPSEEVDQIVDQAIGIGARAVWMQEGITNEAAAQKASQAGLEVVMDACMRKAHMRQYPQQKEEVLDDCEAAVRA